MMTPLVFDWDNATLDDGDLKRLTNLLLPIARLLSPNEDQPYLNVFYLFKYHFEQVSLCKQFNLNADGLQSDFYPGSVKSVSFSQCCINFIKY